MGSLDKLKIVAALPKRAASVEQERRNKLATKLAEQLKLAEAALGGEPYSRSKQQWRTDEQGERHRVVREVKLREWWSTEPTGTIQFSVFYGAAALELAKGKTAIEVAKLSELPAVIKTVLKAVLDGELDEVIRQAAMARSPKAKVKKAA